MTFRVQFALFFLVFLGGCGILQKQKPNSEDAELKKFAVQASEKPLPPEKTKEVLSEVGANWWYGQGLGETALNVGTVIVFPPYALVLIGNAALSLSGFEPVSISDALPEKGREAWRTVYNGVTEAPGRVTAAIANEEFRSKETAGERLKEVVASAE